MGKYVIHGFLRTLSPLHIAAPGKMFVNLDTGFTTPSKPLNSSFTTCTAVQKMTFLDEHLVRKNDNEPGELKTGSRDVPVIPANSIAGGLRRMAAKLVIDTLLAKKEQIAIGTYSALMCGAVNGHPDTKGVTFKQFRDARDHVYLGLFGGGPQLMPRRVHVRNAVPYIDQVTDVMYSRTDLAHCHPLLRHIPAESGKGRGDKYTYMVDAANKLTRVIIFNRVDDLVRLTDIERQRESINDFDNAIMARQLEILEGVERENQTDREVLKDENGKEIKEQNRMTTRTFSSLEYVPPNTVFPVTFELDVNQAQLGLFLLSLAKYLKEEQIGGWGRNGFGAFALEDLLLFTKDENGYYTEHGISTENNHMRFDGKLLNDAIEAAEMELTALTAVELDKLFHPEAKESRKDKKGKKGKRDVEDETFEDDEVAA